MRHAPAGFSCLILAFVPPLCSFSFSSASICGSFKGTATKNKQTPQLLFENLPCLSKHVFQQKAGCAKFQLKVEDWNIIVLQRWWFPDHLHTGGTFDCCVAQSHSTPLCLNKIRLTYTWSFFCLWLLPFYWLDFLYSTAVLGRLFSFFLFSFCVLPFFFFLPCFLW